MSYSCLLMETNITWPSGHAPARVCHLLMWVCLLPPVFLQPHAAAASASRFCTNCCAPRVSLRGPGRRGPCQTCGHSPLADASLLAPGALQRWQSHLRDQQQQSTVGGSQSQRESRHAAGGGSTVCAKGTRVALAFDERMLLHRASLPPYAERWVVQCVQPGAHTLQAAQASLCSQRYWVDMSCQPDSMAELSQLIFSRAAHMTCRL
jgi:hypothetical protein